MITGISGLDFKNAIISASNNISRYKNIINELNIFPVPDGDTGTNMSMTIGAAAESLKNSSGEVELEIGAVSKQVSAAMLRGARGNSGVILAILFKGIAQGLQNLEVASGNDLINAFEIGVDMAYKSVAKPTEGTILTVARVSSEHGKIACQKNNDPVYVFEKMCEHAKQALETTPDLLPVLKRAGVVDSGGKGLTVIFDGMFSVFKNNVVISEGAAFVGGNHEFDADFKNAAAKFDSNINFAYCTEFIVQKHKNLKFNYEKSKKFLEKIGDSVVMIEDDDILKVHIHSNFPDKVLNFALKNGQLLNVKVDNLKQQHKELQNLENEKNLKSNKDFKFAEPVEEFGFVAVAVGAGLFKIFKDLGCNAVISGGQTLNPSTEEIVNAAKSVPAKNVFVFTNNKNIILAAEQAVSLVNDRTLNIVPTRTIPQGIAAMMSFNPEFSKEKNFENMSQAMSNVDTGQVTFAARDSSFGGFKMKENDILGLFNGKLVEVGKNPVDVAHKLILKMVNKNTEFITIISGRDVSSDEAEKLDKLLKEDKLNAEISMVEGGQPIYHFIISAERGSML